MATTLLHIGKAITPTAEIHDAGILIRDGEIERIGKRDELELPAGATEICSEDSTAVPGFIDVHIHGAGGRDVMEGTPEALATITKRVARFGTTSIVATTVTASTDDTLRAVEGVSKYIPTQYESCDAACAEILGIHFEGPFLSKERRGVHPAELLQLPTADMLQKLLHAAAGNARILTIAPELFGAMPCIDAARSLGMVVSIGHTNATYEQARAAIADGIHVDEIAMKVLLQAKGPEHVVLISDGTPATGMPDGKYKLGGIDVIVVDGVCRDLNGKLAGSTLTLDKALRNIVGLGIPLANAVRMLTLNPATVLGIEFKKGALRTGADADILLLNETLQITRVWTRGISN